MSTEPENKHTIPQFHANADTQCKIPGSPTAAQGKGPGMHTATQSKIPNTPIAAQGKGPGMHTAIQGKIPNTPIAAQGKGPGMHAATQGKIPNTPIAAQGKGPGTLTAQTIPPKTDRRVRRTKTLLQQGLIELMAEKEIKDISVKELSDLADINRGTFYLHYNDIYDMLEKMEDELFMEFNEILNRTLNCDSTADGDTGYLSPENTLRDIFSFLERHRNMAQAMMGPHGDLAFVNRLKSLVQERLHNILARKAPSCDCDYADAFVVSGCIGVIETWLNHPSPRPPEEMATLCSNMLVQGLFP